MGLKAGDAGCGRGAGAGAGAGTDTGTGTGKATAELEPADGSGGTSPMLVNSGEPGLGKNMVFLTSLRPRRVPDRLGCAACYSTSASGDICQGSKQHTARKVLAMFAIAACASPSSSWMGAFFMSSLNCGGMLFSIGMLEKVNIPSHH